MHCPRTIDRSVQPSQPSAGGAVTPAFLEALSGNLDRHAFHLARDTLKDLATALAFDRRCPIGLA